MNIKARHTLALLYALIHLVFILHLMKQSGNYLFSLLLFLLPFYWLLPFEKNLLTLKKTTQNILAFGTGFIGTLSLQPFFSPVLSSALCAVVFILLSELPILKKTEFNKLQGAMYTGSFGGMVLSEIWVLGPLESSLSCLIGGVLYTIFNNSLIGFGGKMGSLGFASLIIWIAIQW